MFTTTISFSILSSLHRITGPESPNAFWPLLPHGVLPCCYWPHNKPSRVKGTVRCAGNSPNQGFEETTAVFRGIQQLLRIEQLRVHSLVKGYYSQLLCLLCQVDLAQALDLGVFFLVPVCRHSSFQHYPSSDTLQERSGSPYFPHSFRNSGALHRCVQSVVTPAKRLEWEETLQWGGELEGAGPLITAQWGWGRKQKLRMELQS